MDFEKYVQEIHYLPKRLEIICDAMNVRIYYGDFKYPS